MKIKEGGVMDIQKEREAFETWLFSTEKFKFRNKNFLFMLDEYGSYEDKPVLEHWETWQAAKAQAVPEGFVLLPVTPSDEFIDKLADVICNEFDTTISGSAHCATEAYKLMIESQEPANEN